MKTRTEIERRLAAARVIGSWPGTAMTRFMVRRRATELLADLDRARRDPRVHRETRRAAMHAKRASRRVRKIGPTRAVGDRRVTVQLRHTRRHVLRAVDLAAHRRRSHRKRNIALASAVAVGAGAAYAGRRAVLAPTGAVADDAHPVETTAGA